MPRGGYNGYHKYRISLPTNVQANFRQYLDPSRQAQYPLKLRQAAHVLLLANEAMGGIRHTNLEIQAKVGISVTTIVRIRRNFLQDGVLRVAAPYLDDEQAHYVRTWINSRPPKNRRAWTVTALVNTLRERKVKTNARREPLKRWLLAQGYRFPLPAYQPRT